MEAERRNLQTIRDFVAIASHDLRTPITVINGFSSMLASDWANFEEAEKLEMIRSIVRQGGHLGRLTEDLLTTSKIEAGAIDAQPRSISLKSAIEQTVGDLPGELSPPPEVFVDPKLKVFVDPEHLGRILSNYLQNAYAYGSPPVRLEASNGGGFVGIRVRDNGSGVPTDFAPSLFGKFARADKKTSKATKWTGLDLSIVRGLARAAGGEAWTNQTIPPAPSLPSASRFHRPTRNDD